MKNNSHLFRAGFLSFLLGIAALVGIFCPGCVSGTAPTAIVPVTAAQSIANIVEPLAQGAVPLVLGKNPGYAGAIGVVADAIPAAFSAGNLSPEAIGAAIGVINTRAKLGLTDDVQALIANALSIAVTQYQQQAGLKVAAVTDPGVQIILTSFATGLHNGVTSWQVAHK